MPEDSSAPSVEIRFYHLQRQRLDEALPLLIAKVHQLGLRTVIKVADQNLLDTLDKALWDFDPSSFIPHDKDGCKSPIEQAVFLTQEDENPNEATVQLLVNAAPSDHVAKYNRCLYMFDGRDEQIVMQARKDWKAFKSLGVEMSYWQQSETGGWDKKA